MWGSTGDSHDTMAFSVAGASCLGKLQGSGSVLLAPRAALECDPALAAAPCLRSSRESAAALSGLFCSSARWPGPVWDQHQHLWWLYLILTQPGTWPEETEARYGSKSDPRLSLGDFEMKMARIKGYWREHIERQNKTGTLFVGVGGGV